MKSSWKKPLIVMGRKRILSLHSRAQCLSPSLELLHIIWCSVILFSQESQLSITMESRLSRTLVMELLFCWCLMLLLIYRMCRLLRQHTSLAFSGSMACRLEVRPLSITELRMISRLERGLLLKKAYSIRLTKRRFPSCLVQFMNSRLRHVTQ
jgi:hypothetical protein